MTFTYDPTLSTELSEVRFLINDTVVNSGPRPTSSADPTTSNFADEEILAILDSVGDVQKAVATFFSVLATQWTKYATSITVGPYKEELYRMCQQYKKLADDWAVSSGLNNRAFSSGVIRRSNDTNSEFSS